MPGPATTALQQRLNPSPPSTADLIQAAERQLLEAADTAAAAGEPDGPTPTTPADKVYTFHFRPEGLEPYHGWVTLEAPTMDGRVRESVVLAKLIGGLPFHSLPADLAAQMRALARLAVVVKDGPKWTKNLLNSHEPAAILMLYEEALVHEDTFRKSSAGSRAGT